MAEDKDTLLSFPCEFPIKVFGLASEDFVGLALELVRKHVPEIDEKVVRTRLSQDRKYISVTLLVYVESKSKLDAIYQELTSNPLVLMAL